MEAEISTPDLDDRALGRFLETRGVAAQLVYPETPTPTVRDAAQALAVSPESIIKSLVFLAQGEPLLVIAAGEARISHKRLRDVLGVSRKKLRMASPDEARSITGYPVGAMPPFGHKHRLPTYIDSLTVRAKVLYGGGGTRAALLRLEYETLYEVTGGRQAVLTQEEES